MINNNFSLYAVWVYRQFKADTSRQLKSRPWLELRLRLGLVTSSTDLEFQPLNCRTSSVLAVPVLMSLY